MLPLVLSSHEIIFRKVWEENEGTGHRLGSPSPEYRRGDGGKGEKPRTRKMEWTQFENLPVIFL